MFEEFKKFAFKGNVIDLAVGVVIGGAFGKIVSSLVNDIIMPTIGVILGGINFSDLKLVITPATETTAEAAILYGSFIQAVVDFFIIALAIFFFVKLIALNKKKIDEAPAPAPAEPNPEVLLLEQIRDLLKSQNNK